MKIKNRFLFQLLFMAFVYGIIIVGSILFARYSYAQMLDHSISLREHVGEICFAGLQAHFGYDIISRLYVSEDGLVLTFLLEHGIEDIPHLIDHAERMQKMLDLVPARTWWLDAHQTGERIHAFEELGIRASRGFRFSPHGISCMFGKS